MSGRFPYKVNQAVSGMVPGSSLCNGTVSAIGKPDVHGYRKVRVSYGEDGEREYDVSKSGACDYLSPTPMRPTVNDDRVTPNDAYTVAPAEDGMFAATFNGEPLGTFGTEAEGWSGALRHDWETREALRLAKLDPTDVVIRCLSSDHDHRAIATARLGITAMEQFVRATLENPPTWAAYATKAAARDMRTLGFENVDWSKVLEKFAR